MTFSQHNFIHLLLLFRSRPRRVECVCALRSVDTFHKRNSLTYCFHFTPRSEEQRRHFKNAHDNDEADPLSHWHVKPHQNRPVEKKKNGKYNCHINPFRCEWVFIKASTYAKQKKLYSCQTSEGTANHRTTKLVWAQCFRWFLFKYIWKNNM